MTELIAYTIVASAATVALWALGIRWIRDLNAADTYRTAWTRDRDQHFDDIRESMGARWSA